MVHVEANTCLQGNIVEQNHWVGLIEELKSFFPGAEISMSSIIPVDSRNKLFEIIDESINSFWCATKNSDVIFVDRTFDFLTKNNAPILEKFSKLLRPNHAGTACITKKKTNSNTILSNYEKSSKSNEATIYLWQSRPPVYTAELPKTILRFTLTFF